MVKANGYGLGAVPVARTLAALGPWAFGIATVDEGAELRSAGLGQRMIVFSACPPLDAAALWELDLEPTISSLDALRDFGAAAPAGGEGHELPVHLEIDTGMGRLGLAAAEAGRWSPELADLLGRLPVRLASTFTHFHSAEEDRAATAEQLRLYQEALVHVRSAGVDPGSTHVANSAALVEGDASGIERARPGIYLYGGGIGGSEPVASVRARILDVRHLPAGHPVSYGATWRPDRPARLATLGIGYGDGIRTCLSNRGSALVGGGKAPIRGAVCMDMTVVEIVDGADVAPGDRATLLGSDGEETITLSELARTCGTMDYEILTGLGGRLPRVYLDPGL